MEGVTASDRVRAALREAIGVKEQVLARPDLVAKLVNAAAMCVAAYRDGKRVLIAGNGGSAADAQHIAGELVSRFYFDRPGLAAMALTTDSSVLTAIGNDYGYDHLFARQLQANGVPGDVFIAISTSGASRNVLRALDYAKTVGIRTIGLKGNAETAMDTLCDICIAVPSRSTPRIQEAHIVIGHIICELIEQSMFGGK